MPSSWVHCGLERCRKNLGLPLPRISLRSLRQSSQRSSKHRPPARRRLNLGGCCCSRLNLSMSITYLSTVLAGAAKLDDDSLDLIKGNLIVPLIMETSCMLRE